MAGKRGRQRPAITFAEACDQLAAVLDGKTRHEILEQLDSGSVSAPLAPLRSAMRAHTFPATSGAVDLRRLVQTCDARSRQEGLHVVQGWDFTAHRFTDDITPVLLLDYCGRLELRTEALPAARAVLLDQYFLTLLSLLSVRAWDEGDPNQNFDRLGGLLDALHGPGTSGHRAVDDIETLLLLAVSYFHPDERCYGLLLDKVLTLDEAHRRRMAVPCAAMMSAHLRWGLRFMYQRDIGRMRDDNVVDYPWLLFAVATLARAIGDTRCSGGAADARLGALLGGLAADPWAFADTRPKSLDGHQTMHAEVTAWLAAHRASFLEDVQALQPASASFSPLGFTCNFPSNAAVAKVAIALEDGFAYASLNAVFTGAPSDGGGPAEQLAKRLMQYSVADPARLGAHGAPLIVYDPSDAAHAFNTVVRVLRA